MRRNIWTLLLVLGAAIDAGAQALPGNPVAEAARAIGRSGFKDAAPPEASPTGFKSDGSRRIVAAYARQAVADDVPRKALEELLLKVIEGYEKTAKQIGGGPDASSALAFSVAVLYSVAKEVELDDEAFFALIGRFRATLDIPAVREASDAQKQEFYEWSLCSAGTILSVAQLAETPESKAGLRKLAKAQIENLIGADTDRLTLKGKEIVLKLPAALSDAFTFTPPSGWVVEGPWHLFRKVEDLSGRRTTRTAFVRFPPSIEAGSDMGPALGKLWKEVVPAELAGRHSSMVYRRYMGDGLPAQFIHGVGREKGRKSDSLYSLYLLDLGTRRQPVVVAQTYDDPDSAFETSVEMMAGYSFGVTADIAEGFLATLRCPAAKGRALVSKEALVAVYAYGSGATLQWENIYTGATAMTVAAGGGTLDLKADGSFAYSFGGASGVVGALKFATDSDQGTWDVKGDLLLLSSTTGKERKYRIAGLTTFSDGVKVAILMSRLDAPVNAVTSGEKRDWFSTKKP
jgi:hypothetical protein